MSNETTQMVLMAQRVQESSLYRALEHVIPLLFQTTYHKFYACSGENTFECLEGNTKTSLETWFAKLQAQDEELLVGVISFFYLDFGNACVGCDYVREGFWGGRKGVTSQIGKTEFIRLCVAWALYKIRSTALWEQPMDTNLFDPSLGLFLCSCIISNQSPEFDKSKKIETERAERVRGLIQTYFSQEKHKLEDFKNIQTDQITFRSSFNLSKKYFSELTGRLVYYFNKRTNNLMVQQSGGLKDQHFQYIQWVGFLLMSVATNLSLFISGASSLISGA